MCSRAELHYMSVFWTCSVSHAISTPEIFSNADHHPHEMREVRVLIRRIDEELLAKPVRLPGGMLRVAKMSTARNGVHHEEIDVVAPHAGSPPA